MPRTKKKQRGDSKTLSAGRSWQGSDESEVQSEASLVSASRLNQNRNGQRKRGWRDIEAISERARLKKMLVDIWHEDVELDEDIFGESDHLAGYYANVDEEPEEIEIDDDLIEDDEEEDFEEKEE